LLESQKNTILQQVMGEANFLQKIKGFDKDNVSTAIIAKIKKYVTVPDFTPEEVSWLGPHLP